MHMRPNAETVLFRSAAAWAAVGLIGGLAYREATRAAEFTGVTQLSLVHTHALALGTTMLLLTVALERLFTLSADRRLGWFLWVWNIGLALTVGGLALKGGLQVAEAAAATSPALAGISGTGHMVLTAGFVLLFLTLGGRLRRPAPAGPQPVESHAAVA
jgi:nitric oxide reductase large subunit